MKQKLFACLLLISLLITRLVPSLAQAAEVPTNEAAEAERTVTLTAPSAILMEAQSGTVLLEKNAQEQRPIASITKIMTLLLIFEALEEGKIKLDDTVTVSEHAASMGGSQVFLEPYETQKVETMIKCIAIASANDACVAMAEHLAGSEGAFVARMNERAAELGMRQTTFVNCCGLDVDGHLSSARDVALMSCELMKHPQVKNYITVWTDTFQHSTRRGQTEFGLTNTNKLIKQYSGITGLKTGSTQKAKYCLSATAERNGVQLVAVILAAPEPRARFREAAALLDYGFATCSAYTDDYDDLELPLVRVTHGETSMVGIAPKAAFSHVFPHKTDAAKMERRVELPASVEAPVSLGMQLGCLSYYYDGTKVGEIALVASEEVGRMTFSSAWKKVGKQYLRH